MKDRLRILIQGFNLMTRAEQLGALGSVALMMVAGFLESIIVAMVVPLVYVIVDPTKFLESSYGKKIAAVIGTDRMSDLFVYLAVAFIFCLILASVMSSFARYVSDCHGARCVTRLGAQMLSRCIRAPYLWVMQQSYSKFVQFILDDVGMWRQSFVAPLFLMIQASIMIISPAAVAIALSPMLAWLAFAVVGILAAGLLLLFRPLIRGVAHEQRNVRRRMLDVLHQALIGIREIRIGGRVDFFVKQFDKANVVSNAVALRLRLLNDAPSSIVLLLGQIALILTAIFLYLSKASAAEIAAQLALIGVVVTRVLPAINRFFAQFPRLMQSAPHVQALLSLTEELDLMDKVANVARSRDPILDWQKIVMKDIRFRYPDRKDWALEGLSATFEKGKSYGFVGRSGSGKTTLVNILLSLLEPSDGRFDLDGRPFSELSISDWQRRFGYVPQDPFVLDATIAENIAFGEEVMDENRIADVLRRVRLDQMVAALPEGLNTKVGEFGNQLSGGQAQRLTIARALYREPEILLFDEATSALDTITETEFHDALDDLRGKVTSFLVAHRITTLKRCDRIHVLDGGRVVGAGTYDELLQTSEIFRGLAAQPEMSTELAG